MQSSANEFPNALVLCESPRSGTNGYGVSLNTFLTGWPADSLAQFYRAARLRDRNRTDERIYHAPVPGNPVTQLVPFAFGRAPAWTGHYSRRWLTRTLGDWKPDVIYAFFYARAMAEFAAWLADEFNVPYVLHVGDDNEGLQDRGGGELDRIFRDASVRIAISHEMKTEYEARYGSAFEVLHNGAADEMFTINPPAQTESTFIIRYVGSLLRIQHWNAIEDIVEAVQRLNSEGLKARFEIYCDAWTKKHALALADGESTVYSGFVGKPELYSVLGSSDLLVLPAAFSGTGDYAYGLSMPTKLPEYLASGAPTLVYGPRGMAWVELCIRHGLGYVVSERSTESVMNIVRRIAAARQESRQKAQKDRQFTQENLSAAAARDRFRLLMTEAVRS